MEIIIDLLDMQTLSSKKFHINTCNNRLSEILHNVKVTMAIAWVEGRDLRWSYFLARKSGGEWLLNNFQLIWESLITSFRF